MEEKEFKELVKKTREMQKKFHKSEKLSQDWVFYINESKRLEGKVDKELEEKNEQITL